MAETKRQSDEQVIYVHLSGDDVLKVLPYIKELTGYEMPYPQWTSVDVAIVAGRIVGLMPLHLVPNVGPAYVAKEFRGTGIANHMADRVASVCQKNNMRNVVCMTNNEFVEKLCRDRGWKDRGVYRVFTND